MEIFKLFGSILVDSGAADKSIAKTGKQAEGLSTKLGKGIKTAGNFGASIVKGAGIAAGAMTAAGTAAFAMVEKVTGGFDSIAKGAEKVGVSTDAYQELDYWAERNGLSHENMEKAVGRFNQRLGMAQNGNEKYSHALKEMGVDMDAVRNGTLSTEDAFAQSIKTLSEMENEQDKVNIATEMFGTKMAREMLPALNDGSLSIEEAKKKAQELGIVIGEDTLMASETFQDTWADMKTSLGAFGQQIIAGLMPTFQSMMDWVIDHLPQIKATFKTAFDAISIVITTVWAFIKDNVIPIFTDMFDNVQGNFPTIKKTFETVFKAIWEVANTVWEFFNDYILPVFVGLFEWVQGHMPTIKATFATVFNEMKEVASMVWAFFKDNILPILERFYGYIQSKMPQIQSITETAFEAINDIVTIVWDLFANFLLPILIALWEFIEPTFPLIATVVETAFDVIFWAVDKVIGIFGGLIDVVESAVNWLSKWNNSSVDDKEVNVKTNYSSSGGGTTGGIPKYASGTDFHPGGMAIVGERGAELVNLPRGSSVKTAEETANMMGGNTYITVEGNIDRDLYDDIMRQQKNDYDTKLTVAGVRV